MIRKKYRINQKDLVPSVCSRTNLSNIENCKTKVTEELAQKFCDRVNSILKEKQIYESVDLTSLIEPVELQVKKYVDSLIVNYVKYKYFDINEAKQVFLKHEVIEQKIRLFAVLGSIEFNIERNYNKSLEYLEYIFPMLKNHNTKFNYLVYFQLQRLYVRFETYNKIISIFKQDFIKDYNPSLEIESYILYNFALGFQKYKYYDKAIEIYKIVSNNFSLAYIDVDVKNNMGVCYNRLNEFEKADEVYLNIIEETNDTFWKIKSYTNMLFHVDKRKNKMMIPNVINKIEALAETLDHRELFQAYYCIGKAHLDLGNRLEAQKSFERELNLGMHLTERYFFIEKYKRTIIELLKIYNYTEKRKLENLQKKILEIPYSYLDKIFISNVLYYLNQAFNKKEMDKMYKYFKQDNDYQGF